MLWVKSLHVMSMVAWFAGLFYLPRIFVYHSMSKDASMRATFKLMESRLIVLMHLAAALTWMFGLWILFYLPAWLALGWLQIKIGLVILLTLYHWWCAKMVREFERDEINHSHVWFRWFNEFPVVILFGVILLVVMKPF
jgi:putative membrane protein